MDHIKFHFRNALIDCSCPFGGGRRHINFSSTHERTTVIELRTITKRPLAEVSDVNRVPNGKVG